MILYRYEKEDGGGPFCTKDGRLRTSPELQMDDDTLYGALSVEDLKTWFKHQPTFLLEGCKIAMYDGEFIYKSSISTETVIKKSTAKFLKYLT